jgi:GT2 family glycosyltransferase
MKISAVITTYNRRASLERALESLLKQTRLPDEVLIIDDGSTDRPRDIEASAFHHWMDGVEHLDPEDLPSYRYHRIWTNVGVSRARNMGALLAEHPLIFWMDDDCELDEDCLRILERAIWPDAKIAAVGGCVWETEGFFNLLVDRPMAISILGEVLDLATYKVPGSITDYDAYPADHLRGGNILFWRAAFEEVGGLDLAYTDEEGRSFRDETDLCLKWKEAGYSLVYVPAARAHHHREKTGGVWDKFGQDNHFLAEAEKIFHERWGPKRYLSRWAIPGSPWVEPA